MSNTKDIAFDIMDEIELGELTYRQIAVKYGVSLADVEELAQDVADQYAYEDGYADDEDAFASAGWGTDESYISDNDYFDDY